MYRTWFGEGMTAKVVRLDMKIVRNTAKNSLHQMKYISSTQTKFVTQPVLYTHKEHRLIDIHMH